MKEILAPSGSAVNSADTAEGEHIEPSITRNATSMVENDNGCYPCGKNCAYCTLVDKSKGNTFKSVSNGKMFKIRQKINCTSKNLIYMVRCKRCNLQGVGHTTNFRKQISNYFSHIIKILG